MKHDVKVPAVGESIAEVVIAQWLKADGEHVEVDELICEIESDKASFEIPAETSGTLQHQAAEQLSDDLLEARALPERSMDRTNRNRAFYWAALLSGGTDAVARRASRLNDPFIASIFQRLSDIDCRIVGFECPAFSTLY